MTKYKWLYLRAVFLIIPMLYGCSTPPAPQDRIILPEAVLSELNKFKVRHWKYIIIHHSGSYKGSASSMDRYHREERGWKHGLGYHFVIGNGKGSRNGLIEVGGRWNEQMKGAHAGSDEYNQYGVGICLVGNFETNRPTRAQISALVDLIKYLQECCNIPRRKILMHKRLKITDCPGKYFPYSEVMSRLR